MVKIYTRSGDDGTTCLVTGRRIGKDSLRVESYGDVDELNSLLGVAASNGLCAELAEIVTQVQSALFDLGADLACPAGEDSKIDVPRISQDHVAKLEAHIDRLTAELEPLTQFILPGGSPAASYLHLARSVCRRAERRTVTLSRLEPVSDSLLHYLNRLSDLLFTMARYQNRADQCDEITWTPSTP